MRTTILKYNVIIRKEGQQFIADVPTLGISDFGKTIDQAKRHVKQAISCHIEGLIKTKTDIPRPDTEDFYLSQTEIKVFKDFRFAF